MLRRLRISLKVRIKRLLVKFSVGRYKDFRRFIILSHPRSGSTLLHTYLNSHWRIYSYGELFTREMQESFKGETNSVIHFYNDRMKRSFPKMIGAVGFKFFYQYTETDWGKDLLSLLEADPDLLVIHLKRSDTFRTALSYALAQATGHWTYTGNEGPVTLDETQVRSIIKSQREMEGLLVGKFAQHQVLEVNYEDLNSHPDDELKRVQEFLGVPAEKLETVLKRQHGDGMERYVENYEQLTFLSEDP